MGERRWYVVEADLENRHQVIGAATALLDALHPVLTWVDIDGYSDFKDLPPTVVHAETRVRERASTQKGFMGVRLSAADADDWAAARTYGPWSINADYWAQGFHQPIVTLHDCGWSITAFLTDEQSHEVRTALGDIAELVPLEVVRARRRREGMTVRSVLAALHWDRNSR